MYTKIERCRICGNRDLVEVLDLGTQVLTGVFPKSTTEHLTAGPLKLVKCIGDASVCGLLQLQHSYDLKEMYGQNYGYRSGLNSSMVSHLHRKVRRILERMTLEGQPLIVDIGSNDSTTLQAYPKQGCTLVGVDPTAAKFRAFYPPHIDLIPDFFSAAAIKARFGARKALIVTSFAMFYDLEDPLKFMAEVVEVLDRDGIWVFEQSYMPSMLATNAYDTVCHEHLEHYSLKQIKWLADKVGLKIIDVELNDINGGSFSVTVAKNGSRHEASSVVESILESERKQQLDQLSPYVEFAERVSQSREGLLQFIDKANRSGKSVCALGASTKGNVLLQYCGITQSRIPRIGDVNPDKYGSFTPGTLIPIVSENEVLEMRPDYLMVLPWHFRQFFENNPKFADRKLVFPLPVLAIV
jgi:NDP-4-keto-2,6-dideoxyhexose 3-C-methyltransferase